MHTKMILTYRSLRLRTLAFAHLNGTCWISQTLLSGSCPTIGEDNKLTLKGVTFQEVFSCSRFWMMDPEMLGNMFCWDKPTAATYKTMADSLRKVNSLQFNKGVGVHINPMSGDDFRKNVDVCWNWLDGKPLL